MGYVSELRGLVGSRPIILVGAAVLALDGEGRLLLQRRADNGLWGLPGGSLEPGEALEEAARRELREETGLEAGELELFGVFSGPEQFFVYPNGDQIYDVCVTYRANVAAGELRMEDGESQELRYFALDALLEREQVTPLDRPILERLLREVGLDKR